MHAPPHFPLIVSRFDRTRLVLACGIVAVSGVFVAWAAAQASAHAVGVTAAGFAFLSLIGAIGHGAWRLAPVRLRWDTREWHLESIAPAQPLRSTGHVDLAIHTARWMLLCFRPHPGTGSRRVWIPVQRRGHEDSWHALRATLYGAQSADGPLPAGL